MKRIINYILTGAISYGAISCDITTPLEDYKPPYSLEAYTAIKDENTANLALIGIYSSFLQRDIDGTPYIYLAPEIMGGYLTPSSYYSYSDPEYGGLAQNNPVTDGGGFFIPGIYKGMYNIINQCNWLIQEVNKLEASAFAQDARKEEMIAEAQIIRAYTHFLLLRLYTPFYDSSSPYGLDIRLRPATSAEAFPRQSVQATYEAIHNDLNQAIVKAPELRGRNHVNKTFAQALQAKIYLYQGAYQKAAETAKNIIDNTTDAFSLSPLFDDLYYPHTDASIGENSELLFGTLSTSTREQVGLGNCLDGFFIEGLAPSYTSLLHDSVQINNQWIHYDSTRQKMTATMVSAWGTSQQITLKYSVNPAFINALTPMGYPNASGDFEMVYHMRLAEVYLIYAEAQTRAQGAVTPEAIQVLNELRLARGASETGSEFSTYPETINLEQLLEVIRIEKVIELTAEMGEPWFDLVRYDYADGFGKGFQVADIKHTATNPLKFILPIPQESIDASRGIVKQNPSYE